MFVGHYCAALAAKAAEPRAPLWTYVIAAQMVDIGWAGLVMAGVEKVRIDETLPGSALDLYFMPYTHGLPSALAWAVVTALLALGALKLPWRAAVMVGAVVFSHWVLDFLVHRPDLELWMGGPKVGLGLWNYPVPEQALEIGLLALAGVFWGVQRGRAGQAAWPAALFLLVLLVVQVGVMFMPANSDPAAFGLNALLVYLAFGAVAWLVDRGKPDARAPLRDAPVRA
jgi:hypothetical protein